MALPWPGSTHSNMFICLQSLFSHPVCFRFDVSAHLRASPPSSRSYAQLLPSPSLLRPASMVNHQSFPGPSFFTSLEAVAFGRFHGTERRLLLMLLQRHVDRLLNPRPLQIQPPLL